MASRHGFNQVEIWLPWHIAHKPHWSRGSQLHNKLQGIIHKGSIGDVQNLRKHTASKCYVTAHGAAGKFGSEQTWPAPFSTRTESHWEWRELWRTEQYCLTRQILSLRWTPEAKLQAFFLPSICCILHSWSSVVFRTFISHVVQTVWSPALLLTNALSQSVLLPWVVLRVADTFCACSSACFYEAGEYRIIADSP